MFSDIRRFFTGDRERQRIRGAWIVGALIVFAVIAATNAWLSDDSYITLRTLDNFVHGYGLRWNIDERVQAYTHPLWLLVLAVPYFLTRDPYYTTLAVSLAVSVAAVALAVRYAGGATWTGVAVAALCVCSKAFVDYSTSGLENPLTHVLLVLFLASYWRLGDCKRHVVRLSLLTSMVMLCRIDAGLLVLPALLVTALHQRSRRTLTHLAVGFAPLAAWELFSLVYYGFPFPNTAYAKLGTGIHASALALQGLRYLVDAWRLDHVTLPVIAAGLLVPAHREDGADWAVRAGIVAYLAYVVSIGGDFMSGRFLTAPFVVAFMRLARWLTPLSGTTAVAAACAAVVAAAVSPCPTFLGNYNYTWGEPTSRASADTGVNDERRIYWQATALFSPDRDRAEPQWAHDGRLVSRSGARVTRRGNVGMYGFYAGPGVHIVDAYALADPLLARLPPLPRWRVGHYQRLLPHGYVDTLLTGRNVLIDPGVGEYYRHLSTIVRGPLWTRTRWRAIVRMNLRRYEPLLDAYRRDLAAGRPVADP